MLLWISSLQRIGGKPKSYFHNEIRLNYLCPRAIYSSRAKHCQRNGKPKSYFHLQRPMVTDNKILLLEKLHLPSYQNHIYLHPWSNVFLPECLVCLEAGDACSGWRRDLDRENWSSVMSWIGKTVWYETVFPLKAVQSLIFWTL